jgi:hypothetical protein
MEFLPTNKQPQNNNKLYTSKNFEKLNNPNHIFFSMLLFLFQITKNKIQRTIYLYILKLYSSFYYP